MKRSEIAEFIESMEEIGDNWTEEQVEDVYGDMSLKEALAGRKASVGRMIDIIGKIINDVDFKFILSGKHKSIVILKIKLINGSEIEVRAYDEIADICYRFFYKNEIVLVEGRLDTKMYIVLKKLKK